ncbi:MAG: hypothetical protein GVY20_16255 [Bacteroidetes bacterium]|jgi:hypothetical protein|nr:hypothetical protein [Bacteroidota bacterium]
MNTSTFIHKLISNSGKKLQFVLPDQTAISGDLHITEIQHHSVDSVDCGGNSHSYNETVVQLWKNERSNKTAKWTTDKAIKIIDIVGQEKSYKDNAELYIEFGDSNHPTIRYSIDSYDSTTESVSIQLNVKPTVCKPKLTVGKELVSCC